MRTIPGYFRKGSWTESYSLLAASNHQYHPCAQPPGTLVISCSKEAHRFSSRGFEELMDKYGAIMRLSTRISLLAFLTFPLTLTAAAQEGIITTSVGPRLPVDGTYAATQGIDLPISVAADGSGDFYASGWAQNRVYRVLADGRISLVAGSGYPDFGGDGGPATSARLKYPYGIAVEAAGNL
jgi:hypothetical protein